MKKTGHKKSIVRYEAFGGLLLLAILIAIIVSFFLEPILKWSIEHTGYSSVGAEVNVEDLNIKWSQPSIQLTNIQVTDVKNPSRNLIQVGLIAIDFNWPDLLHLSGTAELTRIKDIQMHTPRKYPGRVLPKEQRLVSIGSPSTKTAVSSIKKNANNDIISQLASLASGDVDEKGALKNLETNLDTKKAFASIEKKVSSLKQEWQTLKDSKINSEDTKSLLEKVESFEFQTKNTEQTKETLAKAKKLLKELRAKYKDIDESVDTIKKQSKSLKSEIKNTPETFLKDLDYAKNTLGFKDFDANTLTSGLLSEYFSLQLQNLSLVRDGLREQLVSKTNSYSPVDVRKFKPKDKDPNAPTEYSTSVAEQRKSDLVNSNGRWVHFGNKKKYPKVWFKKIALNSVSKKNQDLGDFTGLILDFSTEPQIIKKPLQVKLNGSIKSINMDGIRIDGVMDYTDPLQPKEDFNLDISSFPVSGLDIVKSSEYLMSIKEAVGSSDFDASIRGDSLSINLNQIFKNPNWLFDAKKEDSQTLKDIFNTIKTVKEDLSIRGTVTGTFKKPKISLASNFGTIVKEAIETKLSTKLKGSLDKRKEELKKKLGPELSQYASEIDLLTSDISNFDANLKSVADKFERKVKDQLNDKAKQEIKKAKKKLLDKLGL